VHSDPQNKLKEGAKLEWFKTEISDKVVAAITGIVPKNRHVIYVSCGCLQNLGAATFPLDPKMGLPSHYLW